LAQVGQTYNSMLKIRSDPSWRPKDRLSALSSALDRLPPIDDKPPETPQEQFAKKTFELNGQLYQRKPDGTFEGVRNTDQPWEIEQKKNQLKFETQKAEWARDDHLADNRLNQTKSENAVKEAEAKLKQAHVEFAIAQAQKFGDTDIETRDPSGKVISTRKPASDEVVKRFNDILNKTLSASGLAGPDQAAQAASQQQKRRDEAARLKVLADDTITDKYGDEHKKHPGINPEGDALARYPLVPGEQGYAAPSSSGGVDQQARIQAALERIQKAQAALAQIPAVQ
jgi:hypothetical protein